jgi:pyruvate,orthophosphate dikinase
MTTSQTAVAVVTGGARGIGQACVRKFATLGHPVAILDVNRELGQALADELTAAGVQARYYDCDVADAALVDNVAAQVQKERNVKLSYLVGTMIEIPRACVVADEIAKSAQFFSFGTNDLTQTTLGMSRDDAGSFLPRYQEEEIVRQNPFAVLDQGGVGKLMETAVKLGRSTRKDIKLGICGEHGGEPDSVKFCHRLGLAYVSCSPFRLPIARLAAAQAALKN